MLSGERAPAICYFWGIFLGGNPEGDRGCNSKLYRIGNQRPTVVCQPRPPAEQSIPVRARSWTAHCISPIYCHPRAGNIYRVTHSLTGHDISRCGHIRPKLLVVHIRNNEYRGIHIIAAIQLFLFSSKEMDTTQEKIKIF